MAAVPLGWETGITERANRDADNGISRVKTEKE